jgi:DNA replication and repair protein RecF
VTGENGAGKTNLLESLHVGTQGFSPRTRHDSQLVRLGADRSRVRLTGSRAGVPTEVEVTLGRHEPKCAVLNGARLATAEQLRGELSTLVFTPDRLTVVKGGPAARRAYFDRTLARLLPGRASLPAEYATVIGQRNAALRRIAAGTSNLEALSPWTAQAAELGAALVEARLDTLALLAPLFTERADELGLPAAGLRYEGEPPTATALRERLDRDLDRGTTGLGPHLDDVSIRTGSRDLRQFGSQGEQRIAVLALILAEATLVAQLNPTPPLVLLDDVLSELDGTRRRALGEWISRLSQTMVTATSEDALPVEPELVLRVTPGRVEAVA